MKIRMQVVSFVSKAYEGRAYQVAEGFVQVQDQQRVCSVGVPKEQMGRLNAGLYDLTIEPYTKEGRLQFGVRAFEPVAASKAA